MGRPELASAGPDAPDDIACVLMTSGSTGRPKPVAIPGTALCHVITALIDLYELRPGDRVLQFAPATADVGLEEIFATLAAGATVVVRDDDMISSPARLLARTAELGLTVLSLPTAYWHEVVDGMVRDGLGDGLVLPPSLRLVTVGGEGPRGERVEDWRRLTAGSATRLVNVYGPTETTIVATTEELAGPAVPTPTDAIISVGRPLPGVQLSIEDPDGRPVEDDEDDEDGELVISGPTVAAGYLGLPEGSSGGFITSPDGARRYRTGDRARRLPDGRYVVLGRLDRQVKVRGFRVDLAEVEKAMLAGPGVRDAVAVYNPESAGLIGYVLPVGTLSPPDLKRLRRHLNETLPAVAVPSRLFPVESFPRTDRDKIDYAALVALAGTAAATSSSPPAAPGASGDRPAATDRKQRICAVVSDALDGTPVEPDDSFFALGAHSLSMVRIVAGVAREFGVELAMSTVYARPTAAGLLALVDQADPAVPTSPAGAVGREPDRPAPLTAFQRDMWLAEQLAPGTPMHTLGLRFRLDGVDDPGCLAAALRALVAGHDAFRAVVREGADGPTLRVGAQPPALPFEAHDLRAIPVREQADRRAELAARRGRTVFDIATGPLLAATAIRLGDREWELVVAVHHLVFDGWSAVVFAERLAALLAGETPAQLPSFAGYLRRRRTEPRTFEHWIDRLAAVDTDVEVPADRPRPPVRSFTGATHRIALPLDLLAAVERAARARATTPSALLLAGVSALIARLSGHGDVTVLSPLAHRNPDTAAGIGAYLTIVPLRVDLSDDPDSATAIGRAGGALIDALGHPDVALDELVRALPVRPHSDRGPLTQVMLNIITIAPAWSRRGDIAVEHFGDTVSGGAKLDLNLIVDLARPGAPELAVEYATDLFAPATAARLLEHLLILLRDLVEHPGLPVSRLALLSPAQRDAVLAAGVTPAPDADTDAGDAHDRPRGGAHLLVSEQARLYPNATAVRDGDVSWTYTELERHADVLGARLLAVGVTPGDRVAICLPRGRDAYAAVLAVWRAGAAYVPLDPQYPEDRLRYMLADSGTTVVLTRPGTWPGELTDTVMVDVTMNTGSAAPLPARRPPWPETAPTAAAYVIYTSGTTGRPKGVVVAHANLHHAAAMWRRPTTCGPASGICRAPTPRSTCSPARRCGH